MNNDTSAVFGHVPNAMCWKEIALVNLILKSKDGTQNTIHTSRLSHES